MKEHSFVVCAYKESPYLEKCICSLLAQTVKSRIVVVTSTPNSYIEDIVKKYNLDYSINNGVGGITQDWNFGYKCAREKFDSKYITIAHQDDIYEKNYLKHILESLKGSKRPLIIFSDYYEIRDRKKVKQNTILRIKRILLFPLRFRGLQKVKWVRRRILSLGSPICCPSVTYVVNNLPDVLFENNYRACEDWEAWEKFSKLKGEFVYVSSMLMGHRIHGDSETTAAIIDNKRSEEEYQMFCKFWPKPIAKVIGKYYGKSQEYNNVS